MLVKITMARGSNACGETVRKESHTFVVAKSVRYARTKLNPVFILLKLHGYEKTFCGTRFERKHSSWCEWYDFRLEKISEGIFFLKQVVASDFQKTD